VFRLLFHRVRPVFVFDGGAPALKRSTNIARRHRREVQNASMRKTAEKLLMAHLKKRALTAAIESKQAKKQAAKQAKLVGKESKRSKKTAVATESGPTVVSPSPTGLCSSVVFQMECGHSLSADCNILLQQV
jgi:XPG N-terminal domain